MVIVRRGMLEINPQILPWFDFFTTQGENVRIHIYFNICVIYKYIFQRKE